MRIWPAITCLTAVLTVPTDAGRFDTDAPQRSTREIVSAGTQYVARYQKEFAYLLADETYTQTRTIGGREIERRDLVSEFFLTYIPADGEWLSIRDAIEVDGKPVEDRGRLLALLSKRETAQGLIRELVERNARFNIGSVKRTFNEPTLPLLLLDAKRVGNVRFNLESMEDVGGVAVATLSFAERGRSTLVKFDATDGPPPLVPARGELVVEAATGIVRRTSFELSVDARGRRFKVRLTTDYARDPRIGLWLPSTFTERYDTVTDDGTELIFCRASYTNYRRFEVSAKIRR
jgi:hypothetical protein